MDTLTLLGGLLAKQFRTTPDQVADDDTIRRLTARHVGLPDSFHKLGGSLFALEFAIFIVDLEKTFAAESLGISDEEQDALFESDPTLLEIAAFIDSKIHTV